MLLRSQNELQKQKLEAEKLTNTVTLLENESQELKANLTASQKECTELKKEHQALLVWKKEKETLINETEAVQKDLTDKIDILEKSLYSANKATDQLKVVNTGSTYTHLGQKVLLALAAEKLCIELSSADRCDWFCPV